MIGDFLNRVTTALEMHGIPYMLTVDALGLQQQWAAARRM
jgi:hypothetical protein